MTNVKQHRPRNDDAALRVHSHKHHVLLRETKIELCREFFFHLYDVTGKQIKRIRKLLLNGKSLHDKRGGHPCVKKMGPDELLNIHEYVSSFPLPKTHYSYKNNCTYWSSELSAVKMYELYKIKNPRANTKYEFLIIISMKIFM